MKTISLIVAGMVAVATLAARGETEEALPLTLGEALRRVEADNLDALIGREAMEQAAAVRDRERSFLLPQVSLEANQARSQVVNIGQGLDEFGLRTVQASRFDGRATASVPILDPLAIANFRVATQGQDIARYDYEQVLQQVLAATSEVYLTHLRNIRRFEVIEANIERGEALLELAQSQLDAGVATQIDVTRAEVQLAGDRQARLQQETVVYQSELSIKTLLDLDMWRPIDIESFTASRYIGEEGPAVDIREAMNDRPEFRRERAQLEQNHLEHRAAGWERFPSVRAFGDYGYVDRYAFEGDGDWAWSVGVAVSMPLFEGFRIRANRDLATTRIRSTEMRLQRLEQEVSAEVLLAWQDMRSRLAQIEVAEQNVDLADEEMRLAQIRFEQGVADNREIIDAQNRLSQANDNFVEAVHQFNLARLGYAQARGDVRLLLADQAVSPDED